MLDKSLCYTFRLNIFLGRIMRGFFRSARHCARRVREPVGRCRAVAASLYTHINTKASLSQYQVEGRVESAHKRLLMIMLEEGLCTVEDAQQRSEVK